MAWKTATADLFGLKWLEKNKKVVYTLS